MTEDQKNVLADVISTLYSITNPILSQINDLLEQEIQAEDFKEDARIWKQVSILSDIAYKTGKAIDQLSNLPSEASYKSDLSSIHPNKSEPQPN